jgi:hypothetical protein
MTEVAVTLTDYALALECLLLAWLVRPSTAPRGGFWPAVFFASLAVAAGVGGTTHGFASLPEHPWHAALWTATMLSIGVTALAEWALAASLWSNASAGRMLMRFAVAMGAGYVGVVLFVLDDFWLALVDYLPATIVLLITLTRHARATGRRSVALGAWGMALTMFAAVLQQLQVGLHPVHFDHNALYHVLQGIAMAMLCVGWRALGRPAGE